MTFDHTQCLLTQSPNKNEQLFLQIEKSKAAVSLSSVPAFSRKRSQTLTRLVRYYKPNVKDCKI